jgi:alkyl hydroperoxide reductase subunit AhpC
MVINSPWKRASHLLAAGVTVAILIAADEPSKRERPPAQPPGGEAAEVAQALNESWPDHPEWVDMLTAILQDEPMSSTYGWFRTAVSQTRFDWAATRKRFDRDGDGKVARSEFPGEEADFTRLDRNHDKVLTAADFDFSGSAIAATPGAMVFMRADADGNGKVTPEEMNAFFKASDSGGEGFLSLSDLQEAFAPPPAARSSAPAGAGRPTKAMLVRGLFRQEIGSLQPGPKVDESAPDFTLKTNDGKAEITLSRLLGPKPVVLIFGSFTCGPFRSQSGNIEKLYRRYKDRATFVMVYVRDAHPTDGWRMESNDRVGAVTAQPTTYDERAAVAQKCGRVLNLGFPMLVDTIDDSVGARYSGMPGRLYVIDRQGKVAFKSGRGPYLFKPAEMEQSLVLLLQEDGASRAQKTRVSLRGERAPGALDNQKRGSSNE